MEKSLLISIVTYNSLAVIERCLAGVFGQTYRDFIVSIRDNASSDGTWERLQKLPYPLTLQREAKNTGFSAAHNATIRQHKTDYVLVLNPDVYLMPSFIEAALQGFQIDPAIGSISGKLRWVAAARFNAPDWRPDRADYNEPEIIDSTGMYFAPHQRHFDRGAKEPDHGQYQRREYIFGASGAAALYRRTMIEDVMMDGEFFDEAFFAYREDADLAWRAQWMGWKCLYVPEAVAYHIRKARPENRHRLPPDINCHSVKNRFLMRIKNMTFGTYLRFLIPITWRDLQVIGYVFLREHSSLPGLWYPLRHLRRFLMRRREIMRRQRVSLSYMNFWFSHTPRAIPLDSRTDEARFRRASDWHTR